MYPHSALLLTLCPCLCYRGREGGMGIEKMAFYCLYLLANSSPHLLHPASLTKPQLLWNACSVPSANKLTTCTRSHVVGKVIARCTEHPLKPIVNSSIRPPSPACKHRGMHKHTAMSWQQKHMLSRPHFHFYPSVSFCLTQINRGRELKCAASEHNFVVISAPSC